MNRFNVQMESPGFPASYDSGKILIQTFGRGNLPSYIEPPHMSERNNFQQQKFYKSKHSHQKYSNPKPPPITPVRKKPFINKQNQLQDKNRINLPCSHTQFEEIDSISIKINDIIKSISTSCHKRGIHSGQKVQRLPRTDTAEKLNKLHNKYHNQHDKQTIIQDLKKEKLKRATFDQKKIDSQIKAKFFEEKSIKEHSKKSQTYWKHGEQESSYRHTDRPSYNMCSIDVEQGFEDINSRIQQISDKISKYELKMGDSQQTYHMNKQKNNEFLKQQSYLSRLNSHHNSNLHPSQHMSPLMEKSKEGKQVSIQKTSKDSKYPFKDFQNIEKFKMTSHMMKKQNYFAQKYKDFLQKPKKIYPDTAINHEIKRAKPSISKTPYKQQKSLQNSHQQLTSRFQVKTKDKQSFMKIIIKQITLDQDFRYAKHMFGGVQQLFIEPSASHHQKWVKLKHQLEKQGYSFTLEEVKEIFMPRDNQIDPFMSVSQSHEELVYSVVFAYQAAQKHWNEHLFHSWSRKALRQAHFESQQIDRGRKGYISLEDLTFYINTESDGQYRNRDLMLIFNRFEPKQGSMSRQPSIVFSSALNILLSE